MGKWKQILVDDWTYERLKKIKSNLTDDKHPSFSSVINYLITNEPFVQIGNNDVAAYLKDYIYELIKNDKVLGVMLFGSIARGNWNSYSDIDLFIVVDSQPLSVMRSTDEIDRKLKHKQYRLFNQNIGAYVSPLIVTKDSLKEFRMIYLEIINNGMIIFDRNDVLKMFIDDIKKRFIFEIKNVENMEVMTWKEKKN